MTERIREMKKRIKKREEQKKRDAEKNKKPNPKAGAVELGLLVGLAIGAVMLWINSGEEAQLRANETGVATSQVDIIADAPGKSALTLFGPAIAGAGVGWALDEMSGSDKKTTIQNQTSVNVSGHDNNVSVNSGDTTTSTETRTDTRNDTSNNNYPVQP